MNSIIMGFDFGMKKIGVAVGQKYKTSGLGVVQAFDGIPKWDCLDKIVLDWRPSIVGLPINMDGSNSEMSKKLKNSQDEYRADTILG